MTVASALEAVAVAIVPLGLAVCAAAGIDQTGLLSFVVVTVSLAAFFASFEHRRPRLRDAMPMVVLASLAAAGRILFAPIPDFKPVSAIAIVAGASFGRQAGFLVGALAALVSNFFFGQGAWTPWQMYAWGMVGYGAAFVAKACGDGAGGEADGGGRTWPLYAYGFVSGFGYGFVLNLWSVVGFFHPHTFAELIAVYAAAVPFDAVHAASTAFFLVVLYAPWRRKIARVKRRYGIGDGCARS